MNALNIFSMENKRKLSKIYNSKSDLTSPHQNLKEFQTTANIYWLQENQRKKVNISILCIKTCESVGFF